MDSSDQIAWIGMTSFPLCNRLHPFAWSLFISPTRAASLRIILGLTIFLVSRSRIRSLAWQGRTACTRRMLLCQYHDEAL